MEDLAEDWGLTKVDSLPNQVGVLLLGVWGAAGRDIPSISWF